mmetsp:Transcript_15399/g.49109  ORF Transcript_15399/g.49109 Transcript_15399/m.49109 type:complete len:223 (-) Transcript_15399:69-737(-)
MCLKARTSAVSLSGDGEIKIRPPDGIVSLTPFRPKSESSSSTLSQSGSSCSVSSLAPSSPPSGAVSPVASIRAGGLSAMSGSSPGAGSDPVFCGSPLDSVSSPAGSSLPNCPVLRVSRPGSLSAAACFWSDWGPAARSSAPARARATVSLPPGCWASSTSSLLKSGSDLLPTVNETRWLDPASLFAADLTGSLRAIGSALSTVTEWLAPASTEPVVSRCCCG